MSPESQSDEVPVLHVGLAPHLSVPGPEGVSQSLDVDTDHNEVVQGQPPLSWTILAQQVLYKR